MDVHHRKIDLQSPLDLIYLLNNIKTAAQEKLELAIPLAAAPEGEDAYRSRVEELVQEYILHTLSLALPNLTLNGLDPSPTLLRPEIQSDPPNDNGNYESYDPRLAEKLRTLYAELEVQSTRVAELRREAPGAAARRYMERMEEDLKVEQEREEDRRLNAVEMDINHLDAWTLQRKEDIERRWERGTEGSIGLGQVPMVLAKLERAGKAVKVVEGL